MFPTADARTEAHQAGQGLLIWRYVVPDGELNPLPDMIDVLDTAGFDMRDFESLRGHYGRMLRACVGNPEAQWDEAVRLTGGALCRQERPTTRWAHAR
ncbi:class I SAM-dependent methyltransferase [Tessaracoccus antarcticus]|uniref:Uncharacterized protein n=1 Tax=Tessaracoccus antarcticus TaxID=2479848 RepID=A0A3M0FZ45_9ACTN|nr:hypothetical protein EAX62_14965 [Tessaracoccus antarcticus]